MFPNNRETDNVILISVRASFQFNRTGVTTNNVVMYVWFDPRFYQWSNLSKGKWRNLLIVTQSHYCARLTLWLIIICLSIFAMNLAVKMNTIRKRRSHKHRIEQFENKNGLDMCSESGFSGLTCSPDTEDKSIRSIKSG